MERDLTLCCHRLEHLNHFYRGRGHIFLLHWVPQIILSVLPKTPESERDFQGKFCTGLSLGRNVGSSISRVALSVFLTPR